MLLNYATVCRVQYAVALKDGNSLPYAISVTLTGITAGLPGKKRCPVYPFYCPSGSEFSPHYGGSLIHKGAPHSFKIAFFMRFV